MILQAEQTLKLKRCSLDEYEDKLKRMRGINQQCVHKEPRLNALL